VECEIEAAVVYQTGEIQVMVCSRMVHSKTTSLMERLCAIPKLIALDRYKYQGPFYTKELASESLS
jgi:hypothetical protein